MDKFHDTALEGILEKSVKKLLKIFRNHSRRCLRYLWRNTWKNFLNNFRRDQFTKITEILLGEFFWSIVKTKKKSGRLRNLWKNSSAGIRKWILWKIISNFQRIDSRITSAVIIQKVIWKLKYSKGYFRECPVWIYP